MILKAMSISKNLEKLSDMQTSILTVYQDLDLQSRYKHIKRLSRVQKTAVLNINEDFFTVGLSVLPFYYIVYNSNTTCHLI